MKSFKEIESGYSKEELLALELSSVKGGCCMDFFCAAYSDGTIFCNPYGTPSCHDKSGGYCTAYAAR